MMRKNLNTTELAFLGDSLYEVHVRLHVMGKGKTGTDRMHRDTIKYVCAQSQAQVMKTMMDTLEEEEQNLVKRARNRKSSTKPKNAKVMDYKWATAFEALLGYLYLRGEQERLEEIMDKAIKIVDDKGKYEKEKS